MRRQPLFALIRAGTAVGSLALALTLPTGCGPTPPPAGPPLAVRSSARPAPALTVYQPIARDFQAGYDRDAANRQVQTWETYWGWVNTYYQGNMLANGWLKETRTSLASVTDPVVRDELLREMNEAGQLASREWAKDGRFRQITTAELSAWGQRLSVARRDEDGSGTQLLAAVRLIHGEAKQKLARRTAPPGGTEAVR